MYMCMYHLVADGILQLPNSGLCGLITLEKLVVRVWPLFLILPAQFISKWNRKRKLYTCISDKLWGCTCTACEPCETLVISVISVGCVNIMYAQACTDCLADTLISETCVVAVLFEKVEVREGCIFSQERSSIIDRKEG